jgi:phosphatidylinositol-3-phosphatase
MRLRLALGLLVLLIVPSASAAPPVPPFAHIVVVVFENKERGDVIGATDAPAFAALARRGAELTAYDGVAHPSLPNYLALVSGSTHGITDDCTDCRVAGTSLADLLVAHRRTWKTYAEGLPRAGFTGAYAGEYAKKHDPFLYFENVLARPSWRDRVVPLTQLAHDVARRRLPDFSLVVPNLCNDMHDCSIATGSRWLARTIVPLLAKPALAMSVVFIVFDEGTSDVGGGGNVPALAVGPAVRPRARYTARTSHYGLLRTIEEAWDLPRLGASARAVPITGIWSR